jgi:hypothetical protein
MADEDDDIVPVDIGVVPADAELLDGGHQIAQFLFGASDKRRRRRVYHLAERGDFPGFKIGKTLYVRRSSLLEWIETHEKRPPSRFK